MRERTCWALGSSGGCGNATHGLIAMIELELRCQDPDSRTQTAGLGQQEGGGAVECAVPGRADGATDRVDRADWLDGAEV